MASKSVIHPGEQSESSAEEAFSDEDEIVTSADQEEIDTSSLQPPASAAAAHSPGDLKTCEVQTSVDTQSPSRQTAQLYNTLLHHKLREANWHLKGTIKHELKTPYQKANKNVQNLTASLSRIQGAFSDVCMLLQQVVTDLNTVEVKTSDVVSGDYLVDVKI